ncbi:hypothetical protein [Bremerella sp. P1]|uniref:hypothetical protein n=1 Tax=Bremerella sp. P1 TaxID=3026424 RepID=UPI00236871BC|nr:hypothetical protein [Bremerella sp. P1]WDI41818.1 hypothetical protein PSR63_25535 [Bremerella sp. P1]
MGVGLFNKCNPCCARIGYERLGGNFLETGYGGTVWNECQTYKATSPVRDNISSLQGLEILFTLFATGRSDQTFPGDEADLITCVDWEAQLFDPDTQWPIIKDWVEEGGKLCIMGEYWLGGTYQRGVDLRTYQHDFLDYLGVDIEFDPDSHFFLAEGCQQLQPFIDDWGNFDPTVTQQTVYNFGFTYWYGHTLNTSAPIMQDVDFLMPALLQPLIVGSGATTLATYNHSEVYSVPYVAAQAVGDGYVIVSGDSNIASGCFGYWSYANGNCQFFTNMFEKDVLL